MTEGVDPRYAAFDLWPMERRVRALVEANERAVSAVLRAAPSLSHAAQGVAAQLQAGGRLVYAGAGTSGRLSLQDAAELTPTFGFDRTVVLLAGGQGAEHRAEEGAEDERDSAVAAVDEADVGATDAVVGVAASGRTPFTVAAVQRARERGAFTIGIANNRDTPLLAAAEVGVFLDTGAEVIAGSTRLVAGTAQKIALNTLSTAPMVELGALHGNLMVAMRPTNAKLRRRAVAIVAAATGVEPSLAEQALAACHGDIRCAIVQVASGLESGEAAALLRRHGGRTRLALTAHRADGASGSDSGDG
jgi:N-acetylmuramic acid 6-phosphate etherase